MCIAKCKDKLKNMCSENSQIQEKCDDRTNNSEQYSRLPQIEDVQNEVVDFGKIQESDSTSRHKIDVPDLILHHNCCSICEHISETWQ